jgi:hypothetical protein
MVNKAVTIMNNIKSLLHKALLLLCLAGSPAVFAYEYLVGSCEPYSSAHCNCYTEPYYYCVYDPYIPSEYGPVTSGIPPYVYSNYYFFTGREHNQFHHGQQHFFHENMNMHHFNGMGMPGHGGGRR